MTGEPPGRSRGAWEALEGRVRAFEAAWAAGERPRLEEHLDGSVEDAERLLIELVHADLEFRLRAGEAARVEDYLDRFPSLRGESDVVVELVQAERELRSEYEASGIVQAELGRRFPEQADSPIGGAVETQLAAETPVGVPGRGDGRDGGAVESLRLLSGQSPGDGSAGRPWIGRFEIERVLGQGGFGVVYLARDSQLGRPAAVKIPHPHVLADPALRERFLREARSAASLEHPNIVPVHEAGEAGSLCYIVSAYCPGENLAEWLARRTEPLAAALAAGLVATLAEAVEYSHGRGVLHRDIKPANVMLVPGALAVSESAALPFVPRLTDFGLAKAVEASLAVTRSSVVMGTPLYMSPEQAAGAEDVGPASDVYSLGTILYELLAGRVPFEGSLTAVLDQLRNAEPAPPSNFRPGVPQDLETVCLKCLNKEPGDRYAGAGELADDLRRFLVGEPVRARPLGLPRRLGLWCRRPARIRDAGVFSVILNSGLAVWTVFLALLAGSYTLGLPVGAEPNRFLFESLLVNLFFNVPMVWIGWQTVWRRAWAVQAGLLCSVPPVILVGGALVQWIERPFGDSSEFALFRMFTFTMLLVLFAAQFAGYLTALSAWHATRPR